MIATLAAEAAKDGDHNGLVLVAVCLIAYMLMLAR